jgi:hypothetical protein
VTFPADEIRHTLDVDADEASMRAWNLGDDGWSDSVMEEAETLLPSLVEAGYADAQDAKWNFTPRGVQRAMEIERRSGSPDQP